MSYEVLARKWRPQQFDDVVGQGHVTETLKNAVATNRLAHAYLFVGPRGIGKTSVARIFSKALNCEKGPTVTPCDACDSCREIMAGNSLDVLEIDGASNNGVEQIRDLRETVKYMPTRGNFKIYIIDEVHMLSTPAFNALLKTLEEPPPHVKFMFATTEPEKILATIISRCQRFDLRRIETAEIADRLRLIADEEGVKVEEDALLAVARGSEGGLRDAESALDQLISFKGKEISEADVLSVFGLVSRVRLEQLAECVLTGDIKGIIGIVAELNESGKDLQRLAVELMEHVRNLLVCLNVDDPAGCLELPEVQVAALMKQSELTTTDRALRVVRILGETLESMRYALSRRTLLETALIRCGRAAVTVSLDEVLKKLNALQASGGGDAPAGAAGAGAAAARSGAAAGATAGEQAGEASGTARASAALPPADAPPAKAASPVNGEADLARLREQWHDVISRAGRVAVMTSSLLRDSRPVSVTDTTVLIGIDPEFSEDLDKFSVPRNRTAVERAIGAVLGRKVRVDCRLGAAADVAADTPATEETAAAEVAEESPAVPAAAEAEPAPKPRTAQSMKRRIQDWVQVPEVEKVLEMFNGSVVDVRA